MEDNHKRALVLGCFGMDGSHMVDLLLSQRYFVLGVSHSLKPHPYLGESNFVFAECDIRDTNKLKKLIIENRIEEVYNFGGITFSPFSDSQPELTREVNRNSVLRLAQICESLDCKLIQASSSEIFGNVSDLTLSEKSARNPHSEYARSKYDVDLEMEKMRKNGSKMYTAILFPHESERRKPEFLIRKISRGVASIHHKKIDHIELGSIDSTRDWSSSRDFVYWMYLMSKIGPEEYVLASGNLHSVKDVLDIAFDMIGINDWNNYIRTDENLIRKVDRNNLIGDSRKIEVATGRKLEIDFKKMIQDIVRYDLANIK